MKPLHKALLKITNNLPAESYFKNGEKDPAKNPVYISFNRVFCDICSFLESCKTVDFTKKLDNMVLTLWNDFENRLPCHFVQIKMLEMARYLRLKKEYSIAICQCYDRMLMKWFSYIHRTDFDNIQELLEAFPDHDFKHPATMRSLEAIIGRLVCRYHLVFEADIDLVSPHSLHECLKVMRNFHVIMDSLFLMKHLQKQILNATVHVFVISKQLMQLGHHTRLVNHLEFCVHCMESSSDIEWKSTLSFALCQCYYELGLCERAEAHARKFLFHLDQSKDFLSSQLGKGDEFMVSLRAATIKMAVMVFRRCVVENRRRPSGFMKPSNKFNLNEIAHLPWPRTQTESLLSAMFEGSSAQFFAIMMTLADSRKRILNTSPAVNEEEDVEGADVYNELFFAAQEIIGGGGGRKEKKQGEKVELRGKMMAGVMEGVLFELAKHGKNGVCLSDVAEFVKLAFNYEKFEIFNVWIHKTLDLLKASEEMIHKKLALELEIVKLVDKITMRRGVGKNNPEQLYIGIEQDLCCLVEVMFEYTQKFYNQKDCGVDMYMLVDATIMVWVRCRKFIHPQNPNVVFNNKESFNRIIKLIEANWILYKWVELMMKMKSMFELCTMENHEPLVVAELCLTLALILEAFSCYFPENQHRSDIVHNFKDLTKNSVDYLSSSYQVLEDGITMISSARRSFSLDADFYEIESFKDCNSREMENGNEMKAEFQKLNIDLMDIHTEMLFHFVRISTKVSHLKTPSNANKILGGTNLQKAFHLMSQASFLQVNSPRTPSRRRELLNKASKSLHKMSLTNEALNHSSFTFPSVVPLPPVLLDRSDNSLTFVAAPFTPQDCSQVVCYKLFGCLATPTIQNARVIDNNLPGCGVGISPLKPIFHVTGLTLGEKYVFALGAYDFKGNLIGQKIGRSTQPIQVSHQMSTLLAWSHLSRVAFDLCCQSVFEEASREVWRHFILEPHMTEENNFDIENNIQFHFSNYCLNPAAIKWTSDLQKQMLLMVLMMIVNIERQTLDHVITSKASQIICLRVCEKSMLSIELSQMIEDPLRCLEAILQCYELLSPLIAHRIFNEITAFVMMKCIQGLERIPGKTRCIRGSQAAQDISGVVTNCCYLLARFLRKQGDSDKANYYVELGQRLISPNYEPHLKTIVKLNTNFSNNHAKSSKGGEGGLNYNVENIFLNNLSASEAYEEIQMIRTKKPARYLELLVKVCQKGLKEKEYSKVLQWCEKHAAFFANTTKSESESKKEENEEKQPKKKGKKMKDRDSKTSSKSNADEVVDDDVKYYELTTYKCPQSSTRGDIIMQLKKKNKLELPAIKDSDAEEERSNRLTELAGALTNSFLPLYKQILKRRKFRTIMKGQSESRSMMNLIHGLVLLNLFLKKFRLTSEKGCTKMQTIVEDYCHIESSSFILNISKLQFLKTKMQTCTSNFLSGSLKSMIGEKAAEDGKIIGKDQDLKEKKKLKISLEKKQVLDTQEEDGDLNECLKALTRAIVLSHRFGHWIILQNSCIHLWNATKQLLELFPPPLPLLFNDNSLSLPMTYDELLKIITRTVFIASYCLLDMLIILKRNGTCYNKDRNWKFDFMRDDGSRLNFKFVEKFVLRTIEILCIRKKWEKAIDVSLKLTAINGGWLADILGPVILFSQKNLVERIEFNGGMPKCQPHLEAAISHNNNTPISSVDYCSMHLVVYAFPKRQTGKRSLQLSSVPLDLCFTNKEFEQHISMIPYPIRCIRHCRKLLAMHLLGVGAKIKSKSSNTNPTLPTLPAVESKAQLLIDPFPSQSSVSLQDVLKAYEKTLCMLRCDQNLAAHVLHQSLLELANLYLIKGDCKKSEKLWLEIVETLIQKEGFICCEDKDLMRIIFNLKISPKCCSATDEGFQQCIENARTSCFKSDDLSNILLEVCGIWNCITAGMALFHLTKYIYCNDATKQIKCCLMGANFFKALLRTSLIFPMYDCEYSSCQTRQLMDVHLLRGIHIFEDIHYYNPGTFLKALWHTIKILHRNQYNALSLPLVTMHEHFTLKVFDDVRPYIKNQILRVQVLMRMNLFADAIHLFLKLFRGMEAPNIFNKPHDIGEEDDGALDNHDANDLKFKCFEKITGKTNSNILQQIISANLSQDAVAVYGEVLCCSLFLLKAEILIHLSSFIDFSMNEVHRNETSPETLIKKKEIRANSKEPESDTMSKTVDFGDELKEKMLNTAEDSLKPIMNNLVSNDIPEGTVSGLERNLTCLTTSEFEIFIGAKLLMSKIQLQKQENRLSAMTVSTAMKLINLFLCLKSTGNQVESPEDSMFDNVLWSNCLLEIVDSLLAEVECCNLVDIQTVKNKLKSGDCEIREKKHVDQWLRISLNAAECCKEGLKFAESSDDWIMQVQFLFRGVLLHAFKGTPAYKTIELLEEIKCMLNQHPVLPEPFKSLLFKLHLHQLDLSILGRRQLCSTTNNQPILSPPQFWMQKVEECKIAEIILWQDSCRLSEAEIPQQSKAHPSESTTTEEISSLITERRNIYQPYHHLLPLSRLRKAHSTAILSSLQNFSMLESLEFQEQAINDLLVAYDYASSSAKENPLLIMEILFNTGCILRQVALNAQHFDIMQPAFCFLQALRINTSHLHKHSIVKEVFLEMALLCLSASDYSKEKMDEVEAEKLKLIAEVSLNAAIQFISSRNEFTNKAALNDNFYSQIKDSTNTEPPAFIALDIFGSTVLKIPEFFDCIDSLEDSDILLGESLEKNNERIHQLSSLLTWRDILDYHKSLSRMLSIEQLINNTSNDLESTNPEPVGTLDSSQHSSHLPQLPVDLPIFSDMWGSKIKALNSFLTQNLLEYKDLIDTGLPSKSLWNLLSGASESLTKSQFLINESCIKNISTKIFCSVKKQLIEKSGYISFAGDLNDTQINETRMEATEQTIEKLILMWYTPRFMNLDSQGDQVVVVLYLHTDREASTPGKMTTTLEQLLMVRQCVSCYSREDFEDKANIPLDQEEPVQEQIQVTKEEILFLSQEDLLICYTKPLIEKVMYILKN